MAFQIDKLFISFILFISINKCYNQIKIGDNPQIIDQLSLLELESNTRVLVISRLSSQSILQMKPLAGSMVYNTDEQCIFFYNGLSWINLCALKSESMPEDDPDNPTDPLPLKISDNEDGTYLVETGTNETFTIDTRIHKGDPGALFFGNQENGEPITNEANLFWNNETKRLGLGTNSPMQTLDVEGIIRSSRIFNGMGSPSYPGYHFQNNTTTGMFSLLRNILGFSTNGKEVMRLTENGNVGIQVQNPLATLHVGGDLRVDGNIITASGTFKKNSGISAKTIRRLINYKEALTLNDETVVLEESVRQLVIPSAQVENTGITFVLKNLGNRLPLNLPFRDLKGNNIQFLEKHSVVWIQSDGQEWQQIR